ncbi:hypothetical protein INT47_002497 [Mucor saturninus]|uniref:Uncharacterized protein n=1 Tax=Mucor saturninus TaxID=64648 RepID=A0A8H7RHL2_9FUNG|nr:hypothetical protein INT47_002497 [Mucor saturninus]
MKIFPLPVVGINPTSSSNSGTKRKSVEQLHEEERLSNRVALPAWKFRCDVYAFGVKKIHGTFSESSKRIIKNMIEMFQPHDLGEELDYFSAKLIYNSDELSTFEVGALKLSLSKIVNLMNNDILKIYEKYIDSDSFWSKVNKFTISLPEGLPTNLKELFDAIINDGRDTKGRLNFKKLRLKILSEKITAVVEDDDEKSSLLDILETVLLRVEVDPRAEAEKNESEMTAYRKTASILDFIFKSSSVEFIDGETTCKASKDIAKTQEDLFGDTIPLNKGFGRRIDLLLSTHNVELSTNEWKRKKVSEKLER